jgi:hypothetical protein
MASQEHLQMLHDDDVSTSTSSGEEDDEDETSSENGEVTSHSVVPESHLVKVQDDDDDDDDDDDNDNDVPPSHSLPAKKRIKLSLGLLKSTPQAPRNGIDEETSTPTDPSPLKVKPSSPPKSEERSLPPKKMVISNLVERAATEGTATTVTTDDGEIKAMVVDSDDAGEDDAVAAVVEEHIPTAKAEPAAPKRKPANPVRPVRLPAMSSPGLLIPPASGIFRGAADSNGFTTPESVFDHAMSLAGYTTEARTKRPHRGSSVKRMVADMFDSNIKFSLHFPKLIPEGLLSSSQEEFANGEASDSHNMNGDHHHESLPERLVKAFQRKASSNDEATNGGDETHAANGSAPRKRRKLPQFTEMVPLSLSIPYPEQYIQKRLEYVEKIKER